MLKLPKKRQKLVSVVACLATVFTFIALFSATTSVITYAKESLEEIQKKIEKKQSELSKTDEELSDIKKRASDITATINKLAGSLNVTQSQINALQNQINELSKDIDTLKSKMEIKRKDLAMRTYIRDQTIRGLYISSQKNLFELLLGPDDITKSVQDTAYYFAFVDTSRGLIETINDEITQYENEKGEIEQIKTQVETQKKDAQIIANRISSQVSTAKGELAAVSQKKLALQQQRDEIQKKLSELSAKQKALLQEKTETFSTSVGDVPATGDPNARADYDPGFRKAFAAFSFGAPHRKGMSQYGAKGRAESGQSYKDILKAYYGDIEIVEPDLPSKIRTDRGEMDLDGKYLKGLAEMPSKWPKEALKAQAIAARTYAMSYVGWRTGHTNPSGKICTSESCQVWSSSKASSSSAKGWHDAVKDTKGKIMISKKTGEVFSAWYASTSGGYNYSYTSLGHKTGGGWDTKCSSKNCWTSEAYESKAGSPWFYKGWYKTRKGKTCGRSHPWLTEKEFADIVGALVLYEEDNDNQKHLSQPDAKSCWGKDIGDTWSMDKVREKTGIKEIKDVDVSYSSGGVTAEVKVKTNKGEYKFSGGDFKAVFNLRAPGAVHLKSLLFNVEVKK